MKAQGAAELLLEAGFYEDAVSRAYYAVLHAAKAALLARDIVDGKPYRCETSLWERASPAETSRKGMGDNPRP